jgi:bacteriorhodopsin
MNLETCISIIAAFFYSQFVEKLKMSDISIQYNDITLTRYADWFISTPFMLLVLCMFLAHEHKIHFTLPMFMLVLALDFGMLVSGYLGETRKISKPTALVVGFAFFVALYVYIWLAFMAGNPTFGALFSYYTFLVVWAMYGVVYLSNDKLKNIVYNFLDLVAKCLVGIFFWVYFTGVIN